MGGGVGDHRRALDDAMHVGEAERVERAAPIGALEIVDQRRGGHCRQRGGKVARGQLDAAAMDELAVDIDAVDLLNVADGFPGLAVDQDEIGALALLDRTAVSCETGSASWRERVCKDV